MRRHQNPANGKPNRTTAAAPLPDAGGATSGHGTRHRRTLEVTVQGRVQGVGYRYFVLDAAQTHGITGTVKNIDDGGVLVRATGSADDLEQFLDDLHRGPPFSRVDQVVVTWNAQTIPFDDFVIRD